MLWNFIDYKLDEILCFILLLDNVRPKKKEEKIVKEGTRKCIKWSAGVGNI